MFSKSTYSLATKNRFTVFSLLFISHYVCNAGKNSFMKKKKSKSKECSKLFSSTCLEPDVFAMIAVKVPLKLYLIIVIMFIYAEI